MWPSRAAAEKALGEKAKAMELVAAQALAKKAVGGKAKAVEVVAAKSGRTSLCPKGDDHNVAAEGRKEHSDRAKIDVERYRDRRETPGSP